MLIARIYEVFPLLCPLCGGQMRIIALITHSADFDVDQRVNWRLVEAGILTRCGLGCVCGWAKVDSRPAIRQLGSCASSDSGKPQ